MPSKKPQSTNAVIYVRFSPRKNAAECKSCEVQIATCLAYCEFKGWKVLGIFQDDNMSGKSMKNRTGIQDAMNKAIIKNAHVVVYSLSRLARSLKDTISIVESLKKQNLGLISCKEEFNTGTHSGRLILHVMAAMAEWEREVCSERTSDALQHRMAQGFRVSALPPWGKQNDPNDPKRVIDNHTELAMMRKIMVWRREGATARGICRLLNEAGFKPRKTWSRPERRWKKSKWHHHRIKQIVDRCKALDL